MARTLQTRVAESLQSLVSRLWPVRAAELRACVTDRVTRRSRWSRELRRRHYLASSRWSRSRLRPIWAAELRACVTDRSRWSRSRLRPTGAAELALAALL